MHTTAHTARTVIQSNGRPRRFVLSQPPHYRTGQDVIASVDKVALAATHAIARAGDDRSLNYRSNGTRPREC